MTDIRVSKINNSTNSAISVSGAKNSAIKLLATSLLTDDEVVIRNFPSNLVDIKEQLKLYDAFGCDYELSNSVYTSKKNSFHCIETDISPSFRSTYLLIISSLHFYGNAFLYFPSGCKIGNRGIELHLDILNKFNVSTDISDHGYRLTSSGLKCATYIFPFLSVGGTELAILLGSVSKGQTILRNCYITPELLNLIDMLRLMRAEIELIGNKIIIEGQTKLHGCEIEVIPDRIEAITWITFFFASGTVGAINNINLDELAVPLIHLENIGLKFSMSKSSIAIEEKSTISSFELAAGVYPGIVTDMQPFFTLIALFAEDSSRIHDYRYFDRFQYAYELNKIGCNIQIDAGSIKITPSTIKNVCKLSCPDLRGGMMLLLYLAITGNHSVLSNSEVIFRGYNKLIEKLNKVGIELVDV